MKLIIKLITGLLLCSACGSKCSKLEYALKQSGDNRKELEKVIKRYENVLEDSIQLKAALFLIENMPGHYTLDSDLLKLYRKSMDSLYPQMSNVIKSVVYTIPIHTGMNIGTYTKAEDVKSMNADYLIRHIDNMVNMWRTCEWLQRVSFEDFCEYVLPYRINNEPLLPQDTTATLWQQVRKKMSYFHYTPYLLDDIKSFQRYIIGINDNIYFLNMKMAGIPVNSYTFDCLDMCYYDVIGFRLSGIPSTIDFIPDWGTRNGRHYWRTIIDPVCMNNNFNDTMNPRTGKVYRMTYSRNPIPESNGTDSIPELFQCPFYKDVTNLYLKTTNLTIPTKSIKGDAPENIYLSIFNGLKWRPIAWSHNKGDKTTFKNMGQNLIYLPTYYQGKKEKHFGYPILVQTNKDIHILKPDTQKKIDICIDRKYPLTYSKIHWTLDLNGCCIEASNCKDFNTSDTLGIIDKPSPSLNWMIVSPNKEKPYRYWRISKPGRPICLAELEFYDSDGNEIKGIPFIWNGEANPKAFDKNALSYATYNSWIGTDFIKPVSIKEIKYLSRTDDNGILPGEEYGLFYYTKNGWESLGYQTAKAQKLIFRQVPSNALYWLQYPATGKEERIFTVNDKGNIIFW